jgi:hypothetical protein
LSCFDNQNFGNSSRKPFQLDRSAALKAQFDLIPSASIRATNERDELDVGTMVGVSKVEIRESSEHLKSLMHLQTSAMVKERIQVLYLLKSLQAKDITEAAQLVGRDLLRRNR